MRILTTSARGTLSRTRQMPDASYAEIRSHLRAKGYNDAKLTRVPQPAE